MYEYGCCSVYIRLFGCLHSLTNLKGFSQVQLMTPTTQKRTISSGTRRGDGSLDNIRVLYSNSRAVQCAMGSFELFPSGPLLEFGVPELWLPPKLLNLRGSCRSCFPYHTALAWNMGDDKYNRSGSGYKFGSGAYL